MAKGHLAKSKSQAASIMKEIQGKNNIVKSVGTVRNYEQSLKTCCDYLKTFKLGSLRELTPKEAMKYLDLRKTEVGQSQLNMDRQAIQTMMQNVTKKLEYNQFLYNIKDKNIQLPISTKEENQKSRSYTKEQVAKIISHQRENYAISTKICYAQFYRFLPCIFP